jgi:DNA-binding transcriptional LysR family regulator
MDWNDVRYFLALARLGSVRAAGASLRVSHSTVARRIEMLEERLSARLFDRTRDGYVLTDVGRQTLPAAERIEEQMAALERGAVGHDEKLAGRVALTCCDPFVSRLVLGELRTFFDAHPEIELAVTVDARPFDLGKREADLAIRALRVGQQPPEHLIGTKVAPLVLASYVAIAHEARLDPDRAGARPRWIGFDQRKVQEGFIAESRHPTVPPWGAFGSIELALQGAEDGLGIGMLPTYVGDRAPTLRRLARPDLRHAADLWLLSHPDLRDHARTKAMRAHIAEAFRTHAALFRGDLGGRKVHRPVSKSRRADRARRS